MKKAILILILSLSFVPKYSYAFLGDGGAGWAQIPYLIQIVAENVKRYQQLQQMMNQARNSSDYFKNIHKGLENITGLLKGVPIKDKGILSELKNYNQSVKAISDLYGMVPKSKESKRHALHDNTVAETMTMISASKEFSEDQEKNSDSLKIQSESASPKGAAKATAISNAMILKSLNQLIRMQGQSLKLQSEQLAMKNREDKVSVDSYQRVDKSLGSAFKSIKPSKTFARF